MFDRAFPQPHIRSMLSRGISLRHLHHHQAGQRVLRLACVGLLSAVMVGCAILRQPTNSADSHAWQAPGATDFEAFATAPVLLLGEQHDAAQHHRIQTDLVTWLAARGGLAGLVLEMAEQGKSTAGLPPNAGVDAVKTALGWAEAGWPWADYEGAIMAAVRAGVPVVGANLNRTRLREAMNLTALDQRIPSDALLVQDERMRTGHCGMLPESQIRPMTRVQIARDLAMAQTLEASLQATLQEARKPTQTQPASSAAPAASPLAVLLLAGHGHVDKAVGVPQHLSLPHRVLRLQAGASDKAGQAPDSSADLVWLTPALPPTDYCAALRQPR